MRKKRESPSAGAPVAETVPSEALIEQARLAIEADRLVIISMKSNDGTRTFDLAAKVMHCNAVPHDEWYIGCALTTPLTPEELEQLL